MTGTDLISANSSSLSSKVNNKGEKETWKVIKCRLGKMLYRRRRMNVFGNGR